MQETAPAPEFVTRGRLAKATGCNIETIRYYEQIGLMPAAMRSDSGYRIYGAIERQRLSFILRGRELGFSIKGLRSLLSLVDGGDYTCGEVRDQMRLKALKVLLTEVAASDAGLVGEDCDPEARFLELAQAVDRAGERCVVGDPMQVAGIV